MICRRWLSAPIIRAVDHLEQSLGQPSSLAQMAAAAELSAYHFHRRFREEMQEPPAAFAERLRLERAALLLLADTVPITDLAWDVGFRNPETFSRRFRARFGISAREYRKHQRSLWRDLGLTAGDDPGGSPGEVEVRHLPPMEVGVLRSIGSDDGFCFDPAGSPWEHLVGSGRATLAGVTFDWTGVTPPELVRRDWSCPVDELRAGSEALHRTVAGGLYATLVAAGHGPVPAILYQRLFVWSMAGRYRLRPGPLLEIHRREEVVVHQPVCDVEEGSSHVRVRA